MILVVFIKKKIQNSKFQIRNKSLKETCVRTPKATSSLVSQKCVASPIYLSIEVCLSNANTISNTYSGHVFSSKCFEWILFFVENPRKSRTLPGVGERPHKHKHFTGCVVPRTELSNCTHFWAQSTQMPRVLKIIFE
jgi:hypothetical protein